MTSFNPRVTATLLGERPVRRGSRLWEERPESYFLGKWEDLNPLNMPGPFYGAATDTCADGPPLAPDSLFLDDQWQCFVWRQPRDEAETYALMCAASSDPVSGLAWDGDEHWTPTLVRSWWSKRTARSADVSRALAELRELPSTIRQAYRAYWEDEEAVAHDLRRYLYFLETGSYPEPQDSLPNLS